MPIFFLLSLDGPEQLILTPQPTLNRFNTLTIKEGETIGPYQCKADCNPPCDTTWKYMNSTGSLHVLLNDGMLVQQRVKRNVSLIICEAKWGIDTVINKSITLDVQCKFCVCFVGLLFCFVFVFLCIIFTFKAFLKLTVRAL